MDKWNYGSMFTYTDSHEACVSFIDFPVRWLNNLYFPDNISPCESLLVLQPSLVAVADSKVNMYKQTKTKTKEA